MKTRHSVSKNKNSLNIKQEEKTTVERCRLYNTLICIFIFKTFKLNINRINVHPQLSFLQYRRMNTIKTSRLKFN